MQNENGRADSNLNKSYVSVDDASNANESVCEPDSINENDWIDPVIIRVDRAQESRRKARTSKSDSFLRTCSKGKTRGFDDAYVSYSQKSNFVQSAVYRDNFGFGNTRNSRSDSALTLEDSEHEIDKSVYTVVATPVFEEISNEAVGSEVRKSICFQKLILIIVSILVLIVGGVILIAFKEGLFSKSANASSSLSPASSIASLSTAPPSEITQNPSDKFAQISPAPSLIPTSLQDHNMETNYPSTTFSDAPSPLKFKLPSIEPSVSKLPTLPPTKGCMSWCANHPTPWKDPDTSFSQKCRWPNNCGGCPECNDNPPTIFPSQVPILNCLTWCESHNAPWWDEDPEVNQKCKWINNCAGCPQCHA